MSFGDENRPDDVGSASILMPRPTWSMNISQELQNGYLRQISQYPLLTIQEEIKWAKQHYESKLALQELMRGFPMLMLAVVEELHENIPNVRLSNYFSLKDSSFNEDDMNVRELFCDASSHLEEIKNCFKKDGKDSGHCRNRCRAAWCRG